MEDDDLVIIESKNNNGNGDVTVAEYIKMQEDNIEWTCFEEDKTYDIDTAFQLIIEDIKKIYADK